MDSKQFLPLQAVPLLWTASQFSGRSFRPLKIQKSEHLKVESFFFLICSLSFLFFPFWSLTSSKCSGVSIFVEFWIESVVLVHCYSKSVYTENRLVWKSNNLFTGSYNIFAQMGSGEREQPIHLVPAVNLQCLISLFTHEIFILLPVPATACPAINSNSNKGKINSF